MEYRRMRVEDEAKVREMLQRHAVEYEYRKPAIGFVAIGDSGELVGFIFVHAAMLIEPFICENPTAGVKLNYMMEGAISALGIQTTLAHIKSENEKLDIEIRRAGFEEIESGEYKLYKKVSNG